MGGTDFSVSIAGAACQPSLVIESEANHIHPSMNKDETHPTFAYPTLLVHADDHLAPTSDIAPSLHPSTTYRYPVDPNDWRPIADGWEELRDEPIYTRVSYSTTERVEKVLGELMGGLSLQ
jgi:O-acetylhomoserine/O-acetylserine sulfhydrylase-like pyridoxal-dependent enzyme